MNVLVPSRNGQTLPTCSKQTLVPTPGADRRLVFNSGALLYALSSPLSFCLTPSLVIVLQKYHTKPCTCRQIRIDLAQPMLSFEIIKASDSYVGRLAQMVERSLSMREALGSIPRSSNFYSETHGFGIPNDLSQNA